MKLGAVMLAMAVSWTAPSVAAAVPEPTGYRMDDYNAAVPDTVQGGRVLHTAELKAFIERARPLLIDVLPAPTRPKETAPDVPWMPLPHRDIPGSIWLPDVGRGAISDTLELGFRTTLDRLTNGNKARSIVFYCRSQCWMSWNATKRAALDGFSAVIWYPDGADGWQSAGLPTEIAIPHEITH